MRHAAGRRVVFLIYQISEKSHAARASSRKPGLIHRAPAGSPGNQKSEIGRTDLDSGTANFRYQISSRVGQPTNSVFSSVDESLRSL
ncbi:MAG: hypothetical protein CMN77_07405 [Spirochaetaceae bacterium]|nr:hypothetical protein [Spirochaetaceae bacterium]